MAELTDLQAEASKLEGESKQPKESKPDADETTETVSSPIESIVTCRLCRRLLRQPVTLKCLHSFCNDCLHSAQDDKSEVSKCPTCCEEVKGLPFADVKLARMVKVFETKIPECDNCLSSHASYRCAKCDVSLCPKCWDTTHAARIFKTHVKSDILRGSEGFERCKDHDEVNAEFMCMDCGTIVCHTCILKGTHVNHTYHSVEVHRQNEQLRLEASVQDVKGLKHKLLAAIEGVKLATEKMSKSYKKVETEINTHFDHLAEAISDRRSVLLAETKKMKIKKSAYLREQLSMFEKTLNSIDETVTRSKEIVSHSFDEDLSKNVDFCCARLQAIRKIPDTNPLICQKCEFKGVTCMCPRETGKIFGTFDENLVGLIAAYGVVDSKKHPTAFARAIKTEHAQNIATGIQTALGSSWMTSCSIM